MKKWMALALALLWAVSLIACGQTAPPQDAPANPAPKEEKPVQEQTSREGWQQTPIKVDEEKFPTPPEGVYMTLTRVKENAVVAVMHNDTAESWGYGYGHMLQVKLGDEWYFVPGVPGKEVNYVAIGLCLDSGAHIETTYGLGQWGDLQAGTYRLVQKIFQGTIPEHNFVERYLTVEFDIP